jgi:hypothetical protein
MSGGIATCIANHALGTDASATLLQEEPPIPVGQVTRCAKSRSLQYGQQESSTLPEIEPELPGSPAPSLALY